MASPSGLCPSHRPAGRRQAQGWKAGRRVVTPTSPLEPADTARGRAGNRRIHAHSKGRGLTREEEEKWRRCHVTDCSWKSLGLSRLLNHRITASTWGRHGLLPSEDTGEKHGDTCRCVLRMHVHVCVLVRTRVCDRHMYTCVHVCTHVYVCIVCARTCVCACERVHICVPECVLYRQPPLEGGPVLLCRAGSGVLPGHGGGRKKIQQEGRNGGWDPVEPSASPWTGPLRSRPAQSGHRTRHRGSTGETRVLALLWLLFQKVYFSDLIMVTVFSFTKSRCGGASRGQGWVGRAHAHPREASLDTDTLTS